MPRRTVALVLALVVGPLAGCGDDSSDRAARASCPAALVERVAAPSGAGADALEWVPCDEGAEVAALAVPRDRSNPARGSILLAVARHRATGERIGSLLVNPGGPGASALGFALAAGDVFPDSILERFDVVAWDPRGVGASAGVDCVDDAAMATFWAADRSPDDTGERTALLDAARVIADGCAVRNERVLPHLSSRQTVEDMEAIRVALDEEAISYLGFSYGTLLGAHYADEHPDRVRAMVLDGAVDPALTPERAVRDQAAGFEQALDSFLDSCAADDGCAFYAGGDPQSAYDRLMAGIDAEKLYALDAAGDERGLGPGEADLGVAGALYRGRAGWAELASALVGAARGDGSELLRLADEYAQRSDAGDYSNELESSFAIGCLDGPQPTPEGLADLAADLAREWPRFGAATAWYGAPCAYWRAPPDAWPAAPVRASGAPPIVVVGTTGDPAAPYRWAESLADQLDSGVLVTVDGTAHTAYASGNACVDDLVERALIALEAPAPETRC
jgi:pimeloyl-ACP methyl ester carboxylesterase